jgi:hypothetical protein
MSKVRSKEWKVITDQFRAVGNTKLKWPEELNVAQNNLKLANYELEKVQYQLEEIKKNLEEEANHVKFKKDEKKL